MTEPPPRSQRRNLGDFGTRTGPRAPGLGERAILGDLRRRLALRGDRDQCRRLDAHTASCGPLVDPQITINAGYGDDQVEAGRRFPFKLDLKGAPGDDLIEGGAKGDFISVGQGENIARGRGGGDAIGGGFGPGGNALFGGSGEDILNSTGDVPDRRINCGDGPSDRADIDRRLDPRPAGCEQVRRL